MLTKDQIKKLNENASYSEALPICDQFVSNFETHLKKLIEDGNPIKGFYREKIGIKGPWIISETVHKRLKELFIDKGFGFEAKETSFSEKDELTVWLNITITFN